MLPYTSNWGIHCRRMIIFYLNLARVEGLHPQVEDTACLRYHLQCGDYIQVLFFKTLSGNKNIEANSLLVRP
jgi:hypothetical protein